MGKTLLLLPFLLVSLASHALEPSGLSLAAPVLKSAEHPCHERLVDLNNRVGALKIGGDIRGSAVVLTMSPDQRKGIVIGARHSLRGPLEETIYLGGKNPLPAAELVRVLPGKAHRRLATLLPLYIPETAKDGTWTGLDAPAEDFALWTADFDDEVVAQRQRGPLWQAPEPRKSVWISGYVGDPYFPHPTQLTYSVGEVLDDADAAKKLGVYFPCAPQRHFVVNAPAASGNSGGGAFTEAGVYLGEPVRATRLMMPPPHSTIVLPADYILRRFRDGIAALPREAQEALLPYLILSRAQALSR